MAQKNGFLDNSLPNYAYISSNKAKFETIFVRGKECLIHPDAVLLA